MINHSVLVVLPVLFYLLSLFTTGNDAIMCYVCISGKEFDQDKCDKLTPNDRDYIQNCSVLDPRNGHPWERCRTMVHEVEDEKRIVRSCATWPDKSKENRCVDRTGTSKIKVRLCECNDKDFCNKMSAISPSIVLPILSAAFFSIIYFMN